MFKGFLRDLKKRFLVIGIIKGLFKGFYVDFLGTSTVCFWRIFFKGLLSCFKAFLRDSHPFLGAFVMVCLRNLKGLFKGF